MLEIAKLKITQRKLNRANQLPGLIEAIEHGDYIIPVLIAHPEDGTLIIEDGHHRIVAYWLCGKQFLEKHECILVEKDARCCMKGSVHDLVISIANENCWTNCGLNVFSKNRHHVRGGNTNQSACGSFWGRTAV
jgi:hypothetical protein